VVGIPVKPVTLRADRRRPSNVSLATLGLVGSILTVLGGWLAGAGGPAGAGWGIPSVDQQPLTSAFVAALIYWCGLVVLIRFWLALLRAVRSPDETTDSALGQGQLIGLIALVALPLFVAPPLASRDVYAYVAQGEVAADGLDPYVNTVAELDTPILAAVDQRWRDVASPYGPGFLLPAEAIVRLADGSDLAAVFGFRMLALIGLGLTAWAVPRLAVAHGSDPLVATVLVLANPITLVHFVSGAHNESLMVGLLLGGLVVARRSPLIGIALCTLAASVKLPAVLGAIFIGWQWAQGADSTRQRVARLLATIGAVASITLVIDQISGWGDGSAR
jgi:hypothetical protein